MVKLLSWHKKLRTKSCLILFYAVIELIIFVCDLYTLTVKGGIAQGRRTSATKIVALTRGCRQGYTPTPSYTSTGEVLLVAGLEKRGRDLIGNS
jgi:hypothetical protein